MEGVWPASEPLADCADRPRCDSADSMGSPTPLQGELQTQVMSALWRLGGGTVERVRQALPVDYAGAYTTVQTVLNRLADRGLVERKREGRGIVYSPKVSEARYLSQTIRQTLAGASSEARQIAIAELVGGLDASELRELRELGDAADRAREGEQS